MPTEFDYERECREIDEEMEKANLKRIERDYICDIDICDCGNIIIKPSNWEEGYEIICNKCNLLIIEEGIL